MDLENFFEKSTQLEIYLSFFGLFVAFLFVNWQLREAVRIICEREVISFVALEMRLLCVS